MNLSNQHYQKNTPPPQPPIAAEDSWFITALMRALASLRFGVVWGSALKSAAFTVLGFMVLMPLLGWGAVGMLHVLFADATGGIAALAAFGVGSVMGALSGYFLFPLFFPLISLLYVDSIAARIEHSYYPGFEKPIAFPFWQALPHALRFILLALTLNLLLLPVYVITAGMAAPLYYVLNSYLYGREYAEMLLQRHFTPAQTDTIRRQYRNRFWMAGLVVMVLFTTPLLNLFAPILATLLMVHVLHTTNLKDFR